MKRVTKNKLALHKNTIAVLTPKELGFAVGGAVPTTQHISCETQFEPNRPLGIIVPQFEPNRPLGVILND
jgi:hypothetical protein